MTKVIYMPLLSEGTDCWRPVRAHRISDCIYEIIAGEKPDNEHWAFPDGSRVRCREHFFSGGEVGLVAYEIVDQTR